MPRHADQPGDVVLVQCVENLFYLGLIGQIISSLRKQQPIRVEQFVFRSLNVGESKSIGAFIRCRLLNIFNNLKWTRLYSSFCDGIGYSSTRFHLVVDAIDLYRSWMCWRNLINKTQLIELTIDGVAVGDLVNDSFLRFKPAPTVNLKSVYLLTLLWQAHRDVRRAKKFFSSTKPALYLTYQTVYIQHGIAVRVALLQGVQVFSFGNFQELTKKLSLKDWVDTKNPDDYADTFSKLDRQAERLALAGIGMAARMTGVIDSATSYMKRSAYVTYDDPVPNVRGAVVVFLHDFYDSPNIYREMIFADFWEWACFTIETLNSAGIPFFVKPHPNQISLNEAVLDELTRRYPGLDRSNLQKPLITNPDDAFPSHRERNFLKSLIHAGICWSTSPMRLSRFESRSPGVHRAPSRKSSSTSFANRTFSMAI